MTNLVVHKVVNGGKLKLKLVPVVPKAIRGGIGVLKLERVQVFCPACGQQVEAVSSDGRVRGYCAVAKQYVDFVIETQLERKKWWQDPEYRAKMSFALRRKWQNPEYRAKQSAAIKKHWQDPEHRGKQIATHTGRHPTAETRAKISEALTRRHRKGNRG